MRFTGIDKIFARTERLQERIDDAKPAFEEAGEYFRSSIDRNFAASGRPQRWQKLAASTLAGRRRRGNSSERPLEDTGDMRAGIQAIVGSDHLEAGSDAVQARRQQHGWPGGKGRGHSRTPARPFVMIQSEDQDAVAELFSRHYRS